MKEIRNSLNMTQAHLAEKSGVPIRTIQKYESGKYAIQNMTVGTALRIAKALGVTVEDLMK